MRANVTLVDVEAERALCRCEVEAASGERSRVLGEIDGVEVSEHEQEQQLASNLAISARGRVHHILRATGRFAGVVEVSEVNDAPPD